MGVENSTVLVYRPVLDSGFSGIIVAIPDLITQDKKYYVFSVAHGLIHHGNIQKDIKLLLPSVNGILSTKNPDTYIVLPWTHCFHNAKLFLENEGNPATQFSSDCSVFELLNVPDNVKARAVLLFDWKAGEHSPSSRAVGVSLVLDPAKPDNYLQVRVETRVSQWSDKYVYLPSEVSADGQSGTGLTDKKERLVSIISGNYHLGNKKVSVAVLAKQHLALINQSDADVFLYRNTECPETKE